MEIYVKELRKYPEENSTDYFVSLVVTMKYGTQKIYQILVPIVEGEDDESVVKQAYMSLQDKIKFDEAVDILTMRQIVDPKEKSVLLGRQIDEKDGSLIPLALPED